MPQEAVPRLAFFWVGQDVSLPTLLVRSARQVLGDGVHIAQLTDRTTPEVEGVTAVMRTKLSDRIMVARLEAYARSGVKSPTLFLDADMLILRPFTLPTLAEGEVGLTVREEDDEINWRYPMEFPEFQGRTLMQEMPYIYSFVYSSSELPFMRQLTRLNKMPKRFQLWYGDQVTLKREVDEGRVKSVHFDAAVYNRTVRSNIEFREILGTSAWPAIVHFKGRNSKGEMTLSLEALLAHGTTP